MTGAAAPQNLRRRRRLNVAVTEMLARAVKRVEEQAGSGVRLRARLRAECEQTARPEEREERANSYLASHSDGRSRAAGIGLAFALSLTVDFARASMRANNAARPACSGS